VSQIFGRESPWLNRQIPPGAVCAQRRTRDRPARGQGVGVVIEGFRPPVAPSCHSLTVRRCEPADKATTRGAENNWNDKCLKWQYARSA
jgi:hypothetical protein